MKNDKKYLRLLLIPIPICILTLFVLKIIIDRTKESYHTTLQTVLQVTQSALRTWANQEKLEVEFWANHPGIKEHVQVLFNDPDEKTSNQKLDQILYSVVKRQGYVDYFILDNSGKLIAGGRERDRGTVSLQLLGPDQDNFTEIKLKAAGTIGLPFKSTYFHNVPVMLLTNPIKHKGQVIALLGFFLDAKRDFTRTVQLGRLGKTGETYAFDKNGKLLTESRFDQNLRDIGLLAPDQTGILTIHIKDPGGDLTQGFVSNRPITQLPLTLMAKSAIAGHDGVNVDGYRDYRGKEVLGAWLWDNELGVGLTTEIDAEEAKSILVLSRNLILLLMVITILGASVIAYVLWRKKASLQEAILARDDFIAIASHELNTPLTSLMVQIHLINKYIVEHKVGQVSSEKLENLVKNSDLQLRRFSSLINSMLDLTRIRSGRLILNLGKMKLSPLVHKVIEDVQFQLKENICTIKTDLDDDIIGNWDQLRIEQVLLNLLNNAIKFSVDKPIEISTTQKGDLAKIVVKDHGIGIPKKAQARIFREFERASSLRGYGGLGLGLFISNQIVRAHKGTMSFESEPGKGTTVYIELPMNPEIDLPED